MRQGITIGMRGVRAAGILTVMLVEWCAGLEGIPDTLYDCMRFGGRPGFKTGRRRPFVGAALLSPSCIVYIKNVTSSADTETRKRTSHCLNGGTQTANRGPRSRTSLRRSQHLCPGHTRQKPSHDKHSPDGPLCACTSIFTWQSC